MIGKLANVEFYPASTMDRGSVLDTGVRHVLVSTGSLWRGDGRGRSHPAGMAGFADPRTLTPDRILPGRTAARAGGDLRRRGIPYRRRSPNCWPPRGWR